MLEDQSEVDDGVEGERGDVRPTPALGALQQVLLELDPTRHFLPLTVPELVHFDELQSEVPRLRFTIEGKGPG